MARFFGYMAPMDKGEIAIGSTCLDKHIPFGEYSAVLDTLTALAEPNRLRIVDLLRERPRGVGEIGDQLGLRQPQVSKHLRVLRAAGLVDVSPEAQRRVYRLRPQAFRELDDWLEPYRRFWTQRLDALDRRLAEMSDQGV